MAPIVTGFEDDVSSYGVEEDRLLSQKTGGGTAMAVAGEDEEIDVEPEPIQFRQNRRDGRRTSFADQVFPSKSPRMRKPNDRKASAKKSPPRNSSREAAPSRTQRDWDDDMEFDDESNTQDPTATINQHGGATPDEKETTSPLRAVPIRDSDEEPQLRSRRTPTRSRRSPTKRKHIAIQQNVTDDDLWEDEPEPAPKRRTYMDWTDEEMEAVREGYKKFGRQWAMIKHNCQHRLCRRTNVQIKDKFRTMLKAGEIDE